MTLFGLPSLLLLALSNERPLHSRAPRHAKCRDSRASTLHPARLLCQIEGAVSGGRRSGRVLPPEGGTPNDLPPTPPRPPRPGFVPGHLHGLCRSGRSLRGVDGFPGWWSRGSVSLGKTTPHL